MIVSKLVVACGHINVLNEESHFHPIRDLANDPSSNKTEADILPFILHVKTVENQTSTLILWNSLVNHMTKKEKISHKIMIIERKMIFGSYNRLIRLSLLLGLNSYR